MADLLEQSTWDPGVYQFEETDAVQGGPDGIDNKPLKNLANRTRYLLDEVEKRAPLINAALTGTPTAPTAAPGTNSTQIATTAFIAAALAALVDSSPATLDTLNELAAALGDDANFAATMAAALANKADILRGVPTGAEMFFSGDTPPPGWLIEEGPELLRGDFPDLFAHAQASGMLITEAAWQAGDKGMFSDGDGVNSFRLPDTRKKFFRANSAGRVLGSFQEDAQQGHWHDISYPYTGAPGGSLNTFLSTTASTGIQGNLATQMISDGVNGVPRIADETRPENVARNIIIKT